MGCNWGLLAQVLNAFVLKTLNLVDVYDFHKKKCWYAFPKSLCGGPLCSPPPPFWLRHCAGFSCWLKDDRQNFSLDMSKFKWKSRPKMSMLLHSFMNSSNKNNKYKFIYLHITNRATLAWTMQFNTICPHCKHGIWGQSIVVPLSIAFAS